MAIWQSPTIGVVSGVVVFLIALRAFFIRSKDGTKEPPAVQSTIPLIGHILGMIRHKAFYYQILRDRIDAPIFSVPMLGRKIYVISSPKIIHSAERTKGTLLFEPIVAAAAQRMSGCSDEAKKLIDYNVDGSKGDRGYVRTFSRTIHPPLAPGPALDSMNRIMIQNVAKSADKLASSAKKRISLYMWLRHEITLATTYAVYGPGNPLADRKVEDAFWIYDQHLLPLLINVLPSITARKGGKARTILADAFYDYFKRGEHMNGSVLVQARYNHSQEYKAPLKDIGAFEAGGCFATLANTFPTAYWLLAYIYSLPDVLQDCRDEVSKITHTKNVDDGTILHTIDMTSIKSNCPVITATLQEVLRHTSVGSSVREVVEDTVLDGYTLKKGNTLIIPANVLHTDSSIWGADSDTFDHRRFLRVPGKKRPNPTAFRAFGGGSTLCPGRHFATTEVLAVATNFLARFDMVPIGSWPPPDRSSAQMWTQILAPDVDFEVEISEREGLGAGHTWAFQLSDSKILLAMAAEDLNESRND